MDIVVWLQSLGLGNEAAFRENDIDETVLPGLASRQSVIGSSC
jgi:hypothetical protein